MRESEYEEHLGHSFYDDIKYQGSQIHHLYSEGVCSPSLHLAQFAV